MNKKIGILFTICILWLSSGFLCSEIHAFQSKKNILSEKDQNSSEDKKTGIDLSDQGIDNWQRKGTRPLTAKDIYWMIIEKGFYCEPVIRSPIDEEGLRALNILALSTFISKWIFLTVIDKHNPKTR